MAQSYQLNRLKKAGGSQECLHTPSLAQQLAAARARCSLRPFFRVRGSNTVMGGSLDQSGDVESTSDNRVAYSNRLFQRQGSLKWPGGASEEAPRRKLKADTVVGLLGALTALEQDDLEAFGTVLARNGQQQENGGGGLLDEPLEAGLYAMFEPRLRLLDVALMLGRRKAAEILMEQGAVDRMEVPSAGQRSTVVQAVLASCEQRIRDEETEEKRRHQLLDAQLAILHQMRVHLTVSNAGEHGTPPAPVNVHATCISASAVCVQFEVVLPGQSAASSADAIVRTKVEWSRCFDFSTIDGCKMGFRHRRSARDVRAARIVVDGLPLGEQCAFRVSAASIWGWGPASRAEPPLLRISSWTEVDGTEQSRLDPPKELAELVGQVERHRQDPVWQRIFPSRYSSAESNRKQKNGLKHLFSASSKFVKNVQRGLYLATAFYTEGRRVLCTMDDCLPVICVDKNSSTGLLAADDIHWLMKLSLCWEQLPMLQESIGAACANRSENNQLRTRLVDAAVTMHNALGVRDIGRMHHIAVQAQPGTSLLVTVRLMAEASSAQVQGLAMQWMRLEKLLSRKQACPAMECLNRELLPLHNFFESSLTKLQPGLYLAYLRLHSSLNSIHVLVPENMTSALPFVQIRPNGHVTREEWAHLQTLARLDDATGAEPLPPKVSSEEQRQFHDQLARAARTLVKELELNSEQLLGTRLFRHRLVQLDDQVSLVLVMPRAEEVCQIIQCPSFHSREASLGPMAQFLGGCVSVPVPVFQMMNLCAYQPDFLSAYCALSIFLGHFLSVAQNEQRACLVEGEARVYAEQLEQLRGFQQRLEAIWRSPACCWISNFASVARDRRGFAHRNCSLRLARLLNSAADDQPPKSAGRERLAGSVRLVRRNWLVPPLGSPLLGTNPSAGHHSIGVPRKKKASNSTRSIWHR